MEVGHAILSKQSSAQKLNMMNPGTAIHLEFRAPTAKRVVGKLLGFEPGKLLVVRLADAGNWHEYSRHFFPSNGVIVRCLDEDRGGFAMAFSSVIRHTSYQPMNLLFIEYPAQVEFQDLRKHPRLPTTLAAKLSDTASMPLQGVLRDISVGGCRFEFQLPPGKVGLASGSASLAAASDLFMSVKVRNQRKIGEHALSVGLAFNAKTSEVRKKLMQMHFPGNML